MKTKLTAGEIEWILGKPFNDQSEETKAFISNILK